MLKIQDNASLRPINVETRDDPVQCMNIEEEPDDKLWCHDLRMFLKEGASFACLTVVNKKTIRRFAC